MSGKIFVVVGPSGVGKTTIVRKFSNDREDLREVISTTTRPPRERELDGRDYHFLDRIEAETMIANDEFLEHVLYDGNLYGFLKASFETCGEDLILVATRHGLEQLRVLFGDRVVAFLILPPSLEELEHRLRADGRSESAARRRLEKAEDEMFTDVHLFDTILVNDDFDTAYRIFTSLVEGYRNV